MPTLKHVFTINHSGIFRGNGTFLQMPVSIKPGCKQLAVTPEIKIYKIDMWLFFVINIILHHKLTVISQFSRS